MCSHASTECRLLELASRYLPITHAAAQHDHPGFSTISMEREKCVDCGICVRMLEQLEGAVEIEVISESCPTGAISVP